MEGGGFICVVSRVLCVCLAPSTLHPVHGLSRTGHLRAPSGREEVQGLPCQCGRSRRVLSTPDWKSFSIDLSDEGKEERACVGADLLEVEEGNPVGSSVVNVSGLPAAGENVVACDQTAMSDRLDVAAILGPIYLLHLLRMIKSLSPPHPITYRIGGLRDGDDKLLTLQSYPAIIRKLWHYSASQRNRNE
jgi:hypothetical protein